MLPFQILHVEKYKHLKGNPLRAYKNRYSPLALSTCMRYVYLMPKDEQGLKQLTTLSGECYTSTISEHFVDQEAYAFLLYWMIAGYNKKNPFNDKRILGDVRKTWTESQNEHPYFIPLFNVLFKDVKGLWGSIHAIPKDSRHVILKLACQRCAELRYSGVLAALGKFNYKTCTQGAEMYKQAVLSQLLEVSKLKPTHSKTNLVTQAHLFNQQKTLRRLISKHVAEFIADHPPRLTRKLIPTLQYT